MKKLHLKIPGNLNPQQEVLEIAKLLSQKLLPSAQKQLGTGVDIKELQTQITIERVPVEKARKTTECSVCKSLFENRAGKKLWVNYGGQVRTVHYCSDTCRDVVLEICGPGRAAINRKDIGHVFNH